MSEVINFLRKTNAEQATIDKIIQQLHSMNPEVKGDASKTFKSFAPEVKKRTITSITGQLDRTLELRRRRETSNFNKKIPIPPKSYPLTHTTTGIFTFTPDAHKYGGNGILDGSTYITVNDQATLDVTDEITIALHLKPQTSTGNDLIVSKSGAYVLRIQNTNQIAWFVNSKTPVTYTYTGDIGNWISVIATYKSTSSGQKLYIDNVLQGSDSETGAITTNANDLKIAGDGTLNLPNNTALSTLTIIHKEVASGWRTDYHSNRLIDTSDGNDEILSIPFTGIEDPKPNATTGICQSG